MKLVKYSIKKPRKDEIYSCNLCKRDINKGEYAIYIDNHAYICFSHIEKAIDKWIDDYTGYINNDKKSIKNLLNNEQDILHTKVVIEHYKSRIKQLRQLKGYFLKNKERMLKESVIANI